jgi:hypothetical protein
MNSWSSAELLEFSAYLSHTWETSLKTAPSGLPLYSGPYLRNSIGLIMPALGKSYLLLLLCLTVHAEEPLKLAVAIREGIPELSSTRKTNSIVSVERSFDLQQWEEFAQFEHRVSPYRDTTAISSTAYYRALSLTTQQIPFANQFEAFSWWSALKSGGDRFNVTYAKFVIDLSEPEKVYFHQAFLHHDFVRSYLRPYLGISAGDFEQISVSTNNQKLLLGTVIFQPSAFGHSEYGIQFVGKDPYPVEFVARAFRTVQSRIVLSSAWRAFYFPEQEQARSAEQNREAFLAEGIELSSLSRWNILDSTYSKGWAVGTLKYFTVDQVPSAWSSGTLTEHDILLTDSIPADLPPFAGIISFNPSSPGSHVAILAQADHRPYAYLATPALRERARALVGAKVLFRASDPDTIVQTLYPGAPGTEFITLIDISDQYEDVTTQLTNFLAAAPLPYPAKQTAPTLTADPTNLTLADTKYFGGKAANFGLLRRTIPARSPRAIAFSFNLWDTFMAQEISPGRSLRTEIASRLARLGPDSSPTTRAVELGAIQSLIKNARFSSATENEIVDALQSFDPQRNIRFRSSSNVEDGETFTAAGLYDSYSGCVADDLDFDDQGPSICDNTESDERGVFRAIKKVFASFYNDEAYRQRVRRGVKEEEVGMALLVHESFPDEIELANGVVVATLTRTGGGTSFVTLVQSTQKGAVSVSNPDSGAVPEIIMGGPHTSYYSIQQHSSLVPFGTSVMSGDNNFALHDLIRQTAYAYAELFPEKKTITLDYEFKLIASGLIIKQIRPVPSPAPGGLPVLALADSTVFGTSESWPSDVFSNHYLKSQWTFKIKPFLMTTESLAAPFYSQVSLKLHENGKIRTYEGPLDVLPQYSHFLSNNIVYDQWSFVAGGPIYTLATSPLLTGFSHEKKIQTINDWRFSFWALYPEDKLTIICTNNGAPDFYCTSFVARTNAFGTRLTQLLQANQNSLPVYRIFTVTNEFQIRSDFFWVRHPETSFGPNGFTSPLVGWKGTQVEGIGSTPFTLQNFFSQTYSSRRKNITETFIFDPWLEPGISPDILRQFELSDIRKIFVGKEVGLIGFDDQIRFLPYGWAGYPYGYY